VDQSSPDLFRRTQKESIWKNSLSDFRYLEPFRRYSRSKSEVVCDKSTEILHVFGPQIFLGEGPPSFWTWIIKFRQFLTMWPSFRAIGRETSENAWRNKKRKKKTSLAFYKSSRTTVTVGLIRKALDHLQPLPR